MSVAATVNSVELNSSSPNFQDRTLASDPELSPSKESVEDIVAQSACQQAADLSASHSRTDSKGAGPFSPDTPEMENIDSLKSSYPPGLVMGRNFLDDMDHDDLHIRGELIELSNRFERASIILNSPARFGVFLNYLFTQNYDAAPALFYLVNQYFRHSLAESKDLFKDQKRVSIEIFSTFLHEKSPLRLEIPTPVVMSTLGNVINSAGTSTFNAAADAAFSIVQTQADKLVREIQLGLDTWKPARPVNLLIQRTREEEMTIFEMCLSPHLQSFAAQLSSPDQPPTCSTLSAETAQALYISLLTAYRWFTAIGGAGLDTADMASRSGISAKSVENLSTIGANPWVKPTHFCVKLKQKSHGHLFGTRRSKISFKSHSLQEKAFERLEDCWVCGQLLWGLGPQGLGCNNCDLSVHSKCKSGIRETCTKEGRKSGLFNTAYTTPNGGAQTPDLVSPPAPDITTGYATYSGPSSRRSRFRNKVSRQFDDLLHPRQSLRDSLSSLEAAALAALDSVTALPNGSQSSVRSGSTNTSLPHLSLPVNPAREPSPNYPVSNVSTDSRPESTVSERISTDTLNSPDGGEGSSAGRVNLMKSRFESTSAESPTVRVSRSASMASSRPTSNVGHGPADTVAPPAETIPDLVCTDWSHDAEMSASESFEAASELKRQFPAYQIPAKGSKNEHYIRMLCLLEFHQKVQFMVRHLKQYEYLLLNTWPLEHKALYHIMCLDQIPPLIELFRSLVARIDATKTATGYAGMAEAVLSWLTDDANQNLKSWARHCQALSCTNMLDCVNKSVNEYAQRKPDVTRLLQTKHNKVVLVDGLKQMRILYFNLPMIANNIVKDLDKKTKSYREEAKIWQQVYTLLSSLPATIDNVCMPLVKKINKGQLQSTIDKKDSLFRNFDPSLRQFQDLLLLFPHTLFRYWVVAHAEVAVDKLTVTSANKVNHDYVRERTSMLSILLHDALVLLVKDGDRFVLRAFKSAREHASGGMGGSQTSVQSDRGAPPSTLQLTERQSVAYHQSFSGSIGAGATPGQQSSATFSFGSASASSRASLAAASFSGPSGLVSSVANMAGSAISERTGSGTSSLKIAPVLTLHNMYTSRGEKIRDEFLLNIVSMDPTVLVRLLFNDENQLKQWSTLLKERSSQSANLFATLQQQKQRVSRPHVHPIKPPLPLPPEKRLSTAKPVQLPLETQANPAASKKDEYRIEDEFISPSPDEGTPLERINAALSKCSRSNQEMRELICNLLKISEADYIRSPVLAKPGSSRSLNQLVLVQLNLTEKLWDCLTKSVTLALTRQLEQNQSNPSIASESAVSDEAGKSTKLDFFLTRNVSCSSTEQGEFTKTWSTPNLYLPMETVEGQQSGRTQAPFTVQDLRKIRIKRSASAVVPKTKMHPDSQLFAQAEMLASQMVATMHQLAILTEERNPTSPGQATAESPYQQRTTASPDSSAEEDNVELTQSESSSDEEEEGEENTDNEARERGDTLCPERLEDLITKLPERESTTNVATEPEESAIVEVPTEPQQVESQPDEIPLSSDRPSVAEALQETDVVEENEDQATPTAPEQTAPIDPLFSYDACAPDQIDLPEQSEEVGEISPMSPISTTSIDRNDSQKSTSSSGFIDS